MALSIRGETHADYFDLFCENCNERTTNEYLGGDPAVPHFQATCKQCREHAKFKLDISRWKGLPLEPDKD
jgi:hypothetical protein